VQYWNEHPVHSVEFYQKSDLKEYCNTIDQLRWSDNERWAKQFYDFQLPEGSTVLEAGCGIGVCSRYYARQGYRVYAIDISSKAVEITKKSFRIFGLEGEIKLGNVENIPYPDNYFDCLVSNGVIHHTPNTEKAVEEFYRVLKRGGVAQCCIYYRNVLLRPPLWMLTRRLLPVLLKRRQGREAMFSITTPEELVRTYDGNETPIAKLYSKEKAKQLFHCFSIKACAPHYFPARFLHGFMVGGVFHQMLDRYCGTLLYLLLEKPR